MGLVDHLSVLPTGGLLIGSRRITDASGGTHEHVNAATGKAQAVVPLAGEREVDMAVQAAREALPAWRALKPAARRDHLLRLAEVIAAHNDEFALMSTLEIGSPVAGRGAISRMAVDHLKYYAGWIDKIEGSVATLEAPNTLSYTIMEPYGVVAVILTWNGPLPALGMTVSPPLAMGNTVVVKPSELAPFTPIRFGELCLEAGLPPGVVNVIPSGAEGGAALVSHPGIDKISFTGGLPTAERILVGAARHGTPCLLELGGKSATIVFPDADIERLIPSAVATVTNNAGQLCGSASRLMVHEDLYDEVERRMVERFSELVLGDPLDPTTTTGPVINAQACDRILGMINEAVASGAGQLLIGGKRAGGDLADGFFIEPTIFGRVDNNSFIAQNEVFGPVLCMLSFTDEDEAVRMANDTRYGLTGAVWTRDVARAHRVCGQLECGYTGVNCKPYPTHNVPFGGVKASGFGKVGGLPGALEFVRPKHVWVDMN